MVACLIITSKQIKQDFVLYHLEYDSLLNQLSNLMTFNIPKNIMKIKTFTEQGLTLSTPSVASVEKESAS